MTTPQPSFPNICVFGDSIAWGAMDDLHGGWVQLLRRWSLTESPLLPHVLNLGIPGDRLSTVQQRFVPEATHRNPSGIIIAIGINDSPHHADLPATPLPTFASLYRDLLVAALRFTPHVLTVGLTNVLEGHPSHRFHNANIRPYDACEHDIATLMGIPFVRIHGLIPKESLTWDGLHPDHTGHIVMFDAILPYYKTLLETLSG